MNRRTLLAAFTLAALPLPAFAAESPKDIVAMLYRVSAGKSGKYDVESAFFNAKIRKEYFTKSLAISLDTLDRLSKKKGEPGIDFDPITNSQDPSVNDLKIVQTDDGEGKSSVIASFQSHNEKARISVKYDFITEDGGWKLATMSGRAFDETWELRALIKAITEELK